MLAVGGKMGIVLLDSETYTIRSQLTLPDISTISASTFSGVSQRPSRIRSVDFSPDGGILACGMSDGTVLFVNALENSEGGIAQVCGVLCGLHSREDEIYKVIFNHDGTKLLSSGTERKPAVWNVIDKTVLFQFEVGLNNSLRFINGGTAIVYITPDSMIRTIDSNSGDVSTEADFNKFRSRVTFHVILNNQGNLIAESGVGGEILVFAFQQGCIHEKARLVAHTQPSLSMAFDHGGSKLASYSRDRTIRIWDIDIGISMYCFSCANPLVSLRFHPNDRQVVGLCTYADQVVVFDLNSQSSFDAPGGTGAISASFSPVCTVLM
jgi:WD40 repeat protein